VNIRTKRWTAIAVLLGLALSGCGGGGGDAGDVGHDVGQRQRALLGVLPVPRWGVANAVSDSFRIIGGREPFRVGSTVDGLEVGFADSNNQFVLPRRAMPTAIMVLTGQDPKFAIRTTLPCGSDVTVLVLDAFSRSASVSVKVENAGRDQSLIEGFVDELS
jgi:hypothetical protein